MRRFLNPAIAIVMLAIPGAVFANVTGTPTLNSGQMLSLDTGTVVSSGGDIQFTGTGISFQGSAAGQNLSPFGLTGASDFTGITTSQSTLTAIATNITSTSITPLTTNQIIAYQTNGGNTGALLLTAVSSSAITFQFVTFVSTTPVITSVLNNYGLVPAGFSNSGISPGMLFIIKGSHLASATSVSSLQSTTGGAMLPTLLNGATVKVTVGSTSVSPAFYYAENVQLALVLPSNTPLGAGTVTVTYNGQPSNAFPVQVTASAFGFAASSGTGSGQAHAQDLSYGYYSYNRSIPPGSTIRLIGSGLGGDPTRDLQYVQPSAASAINALAHVYVGSVEASIFYQGPEGYPGVDEVDLTIPANAPTGCNVSLVGVTASGASTNFLTLPIGNGVCEDPGLGTTGNTITAPSGQTSYSVGSVDLIQSTVPTTGGGTQTTQTAEADFFSVSGITIPTSSSSSSSIGTLSLGGCIVVQSGLTSTGTVPTSTVTTTGLNAGTITVTGPAGMATLVPLSTIDPGFAGTAGIYATLDKSGNSTLPAGFIPTSGGTFQFQGTGGTIAPSVGPFTTQVVFSTPLLTWTNQAQDATVTRSAGLPITWAGGSDGTYVVISGSSIATALSAYGFFTCLAPVAAHQFTVPSYVLGALPAGTGSLIVENETVPQTFTATGIDFGYAIGLLSYEINATYK